ncbi:hypothetical protein KR044_001529, partial [Drosophila immigrans]
KRILIMAVGETVKFLESQLAYKYVELGLAIMGLRPLPDQNPNYRMMFDFWSFTVLSVLEVYLPIAFVVAFVKNMDNITPDELLASLAMFFNLPACGIKVIILLTNRWRFDRAKDMLQTMYKRCEKYEERVQINKLVQRCDTFTILYTVAYLMTPTLMLISSVLSGRAPFNIYIPNLDWRESKRNLWIASFIEFVLLSMGISCCILVDCLPSIFGLTVRGHMKLLIERVENLRKDPKSNENDNYEELVLCIMDHRLIIEYCANMRPIISRSLFVQFTAMGFVLACTLIHLLFFANFLTALSAIWYLATCVLQSFPICFTCDHILADCQKLALTIFHSNWIGADHRYTSALRHFMHNAQQPIRFMGCGVLPI